MTSASGGGGGTSFNAFFWSLAMQESGGSYKAVNRGSGALGRYQIMPYNVPLWSQKYLGVSWSPSQFLNDPRKQDKLARAVLQDFYQKWGPRGAASAWYSGDPSLQNSYRPQRGGPPIGSYVDSVIARSGSWSGQLTGGAEGEVYVPAGQGQPTWEPKPYDGLITIQDQRLGQKPAPDPFADAYPGSGAVGAPGAEAETGLAGNTQESDLLVAPGAAITETTSPFDPRANDPGTPTLTPAPAQDAGAADGPMGGGSVQGYQNQMKILGQQFPGLRMTSGFRPGAVTSSGNVSFHAKGRAVDLPPSMAIFNWIRANYGATSKELIFTPAGGKQIKDGKAFRYSGQVIPDHVAHIHWAM